LTDNEDAEKHYTVGATVSLHTYTFINLIF